MKNNSKEFKENVLALIKTIISSKDGEIVDSKYIHKNGANIAVVRVIAGCGCSSQYNIIYLVWEKNSNLIYEKIFMSYDIEEDLLIENIYNTDEQIIFNITNAGEWRFPIAKFFN